MRAWPPVAAHSAKVRSPRQHGCVRSMRCRVFSRVQAGAGLVRGRLDTALPDGHGHHCLPPAPQMATGSPRRRPHRAAGRAMNRPIATRIVPRPVPTGSGSLDPIETTSRRPFQHDPLGCINYPTTSFGLQIRQFHCVPVLRRHPLLRCSSKHNPSIQTATSKTRLLSRQSYNRNLKDTD